MNEVMTPLDKVFMIEATVRLNFDNMLCIYRSGYTRIPVYLDERKNVIGILFVKVSTMSTQLWLSYGGLSKLRLCFGSLVVCLFFI